MYGLVNIERDSNDILAEYIAKNHKELVAYARVQIIGQHSVNDGTALADDLISDLYMSVVVGSEDRDGVASDVDAEKVLHSYICKAARGVKYLEGSRNVCKKNKDDIVVAEYKVETIFNVDGGLREDVECLDVSEDEDDMFAFHSYDVDNARAYMSDSFEQAAENVDDYVGMFMMLAHELDVISKDNLPKKEERTAKVINTAAQIIKFKDMSDEFKEAFRVLVAEAVSKARA